LAAVQDLNDPLHPNLDTKITLADPKSVQPGGEMPAMVLSLDSRSVGWMPNAMLLALAGATPWNWSRRLKALLGGGLVVNAFVAVSILARVGDAVLGAQSSGWHSLLLMLDNHLLVENLWLSFLFPTLVWLALLIKI